MNRFKKIFWTAVATLGLAALVLAPPASADIVHADDVIIQFSLCVGNDCVNGESFGFDTIRLKENNIRIKFLDTSNTASFPSNDWELTANDSSNGGLNHFSITDISGSRTPFRVEAGARTNALYVESDGDIGIGTSNPVTELHIVRGDTPTMRLEQDGSSGFTPQTWDVAGNEAGFFVRDTTNGSRLVFRIRPGAPVSSIDVQATGAVGIRTSNPTVLSTANMTMTVGPSADGPARLGFQTSGGDWALVADQNTNNLILASDDGTIRQVLQFPAVALAGSSGAGTQLCIGTNNVLCACGACP